MSDFKEKYQKLLNSTRHVALATVNEDGSPHNTPLFFIYNEDLSKVYWGSHPDSLHSKNVIRTGQAYLVVFSSEVYDQGGLYLRLVNAHVVDDEELDVALSVHNTIRAKWGKGPIPREYYAGDKPQKMYVADVDSLEAYTDNRDFNGAIVEEIRLEIRAEDILDD